MAGNRNALRFEGCSRIIFFLWEQAARYTALLKDRDASRLRPLFFPITRASLVGHFMRSSATPLQGFVPEFHLNNIERPGAPSSQFY